ncbi:AMP-binding protein [Ruminobacter sp.]|uniref:AMP-binding protein n=1 Tax=Ruminobacter sp. TaxID=2774296 RepID=UPI00386C99B3
MKTLFSVFADTSIHHQTMFFDDEYLYSGKDIIALSFLCHAVLHERTDCGDFVIATDNPAVMLPLMFAGWLLGRNIIQPNTLQAEGFRVFDPKKTLCVFGEKRIYDETCEYFTDNDAASGKSLNADVTKPALTDLSAVFDAYRSACCASVAGFSCSVKSGDVCRKGIHAFTAETAGILRDILSGNDITGVRDSLSEQFPGLAVGNPEDFIAVLADFMSDPLNETRLCITGLTSGSTGLPKRVPRTLGDFYSEIDCVRGFILPSYAENTVGAATVTNFHAYGVLFRFLLPVISEIPVYVHMLEYQEQFIRLKKFGRNLFLVSNPGFFKRLDGESCPVKVNLMMSAGGRLNLPVLDKAGTVYDAPLLEIYGSTETGVMAYRYPVTAEEDWCVPETSVAEAVDENGNPVDGPGLIRITAAHVNGGIPYTGSDVICLNQVRDGRTSFSLLGRSDRIIKLEDNRVSLDELEKTMAGHEFIRECAVIKYEYNGREFIGAMLVLSENGKRAYAAETPGRFFIRLRNELSRGMVRLAVPRRFIITDELPLTDSRKIAYRKVERAFNHESA